MRRRIQPWALALVVVACTEQPDPAGVASTANRRSSVGDQGVVASATGGIQRIRGDDLWVMAFTAVQRADGSTTGNYHVDRQDLGIRFDVDVTCMSVHGDTAWIAGIIRKVDGPLVREGTISYFWAVDKGEGDDAVDLASAIRINDLPGRDQEFCTLNPKLLVLSPVDYGNLQIRSH
jgi:hypothetical protein